MSAKKGYGQLVSDVERLQINNDQLYQKLNAKDAELTAARDEAEKLRGRVSELEHLIRYAQVESGVCMCGDEIESHNQASGHSPVDIWDHAAEKALEGTSGAWLLRKQADAVEFSASEARTHLIECAWPQSGLPDEAAIALEEVEGHAGRLRDEADAIEKGERDARP